MKTSLTWIEGMKFDARAGSNTIRMDAKSPIGQGTAQTPKELVAAGLGGCTAMDVVALLKKHKQTFQNFKVDVDLDVTTSGQPTVFTGALITFTVTGTVDPNILTEAVTLSQTKYCGVTAMLVHAFPISYKIVLNDVEIATGKADFTSSSR